MVVLEVGIDARGAVTGGQQAFSAFAQLSSGVGVLTQGVGKADTAMQVFGKGLIASQPYILAVVAVLSAVSIGMQAFGRDTDAATRSVNEHTKALQGMITKSKEHSFRAGLGQVDPRKTVGGTIDALTSLAFGKSPNEMMSASRAATLFGLPEFAFREALSPIVGDEAAMGQRRMQSLRDITHPRGRLAFTTTQFSIRDIIAAGENVLKFRQHPGQASESVDSGFGSGGGGFDMRQFLGEPMTGLGPSFGFGQGGSTVFLNQQQSNLQQSVDSQNAIDANNQKSREEMKQILALSQQINDNLGDAAFDFLAGLRSGKEVLGSMLLDLGRMLSRQAMQELIGKGSGQVAASLFG